MEPALMDLKILLPFKIFAQVPQVKRLVVETSAGHYGFLPQRLDCVVALVAGILMYETAVDGEQYIAVDKGIMVKSGTTLMVSVRNAIGGADLGELHESVQKEFKELSDNQKNVRSVMAKMESSFMLRLQKFQQQ